MSGVIFTASAADRIAQAVGIAEREKGAGASYAGDTPSAEVVLARVTSGTPDGSGNYPATITAYSAVDATWEDYGAIKLKGSNGETLVSGTRYSCRPAGISGSDDVYVTLSGGGGGVTVEEVDGTPSYSGITTLRFDQADGFIVTNPSAGISRIDISAASSTDVGIVTTGTQSIAGRKTLLSGVNISAGTTTSGTENGNAIELVFPDNNRIHMNGAGSTGFQIDSNGVPAGGVYIHLLRCEANGSVGRFIGAMPYGSSNRFGIYLDGFNSWTGSGFVANSLEGKYGTLLEGATVTGGIITNLGTGGTGLTGTVP